MIRMAPRPEPAVPAWHAAFLAMLPAIVTQARFAFRRPQSRGPRRCHPGSDCQRLGGLRPAGPTEQSRTRLPECLARYAVAQIQDGRRVGNRLNVRDVLSPYAQKQKDIKVERLDRFDEKDNEWV